VVKILVLNCGSSSVKYKLIDIEKEVDLAKGVVERIGTSGALLTQWMGKKKPVKLTAEILDHREAIKLTLEALLHPKAELLKDKKDIAAVGHRVVHGGEKFAYSVLITEEVKDDIKDCMELAPLHNRHNLRGIVACEELLPGIPQVAVFDTAFHQTMPRSAYIYGLPYIQYRKYGIRRYGFHGTSHLYVAQKAAHLMGRPLTDLKVITCHLGNGASIAAIKGGISIDTSMGFTPLEGLVMGTRCGDIDPAIVLYIMSNEGLSVNELNTMLNFHSGLQGLSGISNDMYDILQEEKKGNDRARLTVEIFTYHVRKYIASYAGAMGGVDAIVFTAGMGENAPRIRSLSCNGLEFLGIMLDKKKNEKTIKKEGEISTPSSKVKVYCIPTNEELVIARDTYTVITRRKKK
jgi:acetate kinase